MRYTLDAVNTAEESTRKCRKCSSRRTHPFGSPSGRIGTLLLGIPQVTDHALRIKRSPPYRFSCLNNHYCRIIVHEHWGLQGRRIVHRRAYTYKPYLGGMEYIYIWVPSLIEFGELLEDLELPVDTSMLNRNHIYPEIGRPQPQPVQPSLPSFNELLTTIPLPDEFTQHQATRLGAGEMAGHRPMSIAPPEPAHLRHQVVNQAIQQPSPGSHSWQVLNAHYVPTHNGHYAAPPSTIIDQFKIPTPPPSTDSVKEPRAREKRRHTCKICTRSFTTSGHLARHNRIHTGERKHSCPWPSCDARFARQDNCMQHYKTHKNGKKRAKKFSTLGAEL